jgi:quinol monooxygenase YgiN
MNTNEKIECLLLYENWRSQHQHEFYTNIEMIEEYVKQE